ncbi:MAG: excinuclease ABC subunit B [Kiritimatiellia bacterium]|jgi:excinuclease ABC subunit B
MSVPFEVVSDFVPTGDQPEAIAALLGGLESGKRFQTLEGVTGSGKTFTMANVIAQHQKPTLLISHNKTLAAQLYSELKHFLPNNAVHYFVSYFDYYQPEAYIPGTDTFIEKDSAINEEIERLRLAATDALLNRTDVVIVASVSCIYGLGSPVDYKAMLVQISVGETIERDDILERLVNVQYTRNEIERAPGTFRVRGDNVDVFPSYNEEGIRLTFFGDEVEAIQRINPLTGDVIDDLDHVGISPAKHFVTPYEKVKDVLPAIQEECDQRVAVFEQQNKLLEAQRIRMRTEYDLEMLRELGFCSGIENYSRYLTGRAKGSRPFTLLDYFDGEFLTVIDESHVTIPQVRGMFNGDMARKTTLVDHGFRLPSAMDNRPLNFGEFLDVVGDITFVSATPGPYELEQSGEPVRQVIRPTGIIEPEIEVRPLKGQIDDLMEEVRVRAARDERVLVTTLTKRTSEDLSEYLQGAGLKVKYLHSDIDAIERVEILRALRRKEFDCLIGINLLREGLDLPEVSLVAILDADKEGFLRSKTALIQTAGRAARNAAGKVIMYADKVTASMQGLLDVTEQRRTRQLEYNETHGITPRTVIKSIQESLSSREDEAEEVNMRMVADSGVDYDVNEVINELEREMLEAAQSLEFERAAILRDQIAELRMTFNTGTGSSSKKGRTTYGKRKGKNVAKKK